jgi:hypothetical protein
MPQPSATDRRKNLLTTYCSLHEEGQGDHDRQRRQRG